VEYTFHSIDDNLELKHHMDQYNYNVKVVEDHFGQGTRVYGTKWLKKEESSISG
jgi:hypothetical protein